MMNTDHAIQTKMTRNYLIISVVIIILLIPELGFSQDNRRSWGIGFGPIYNGIGTSVFYKHPNLFTYTSIGCIQIGYQPGYNLLYNCGIGIGIGNILSINNNKKHAVSAQLGISHNKSSRESIGTAYQLGANYIYFFREYENRGWNIELSPMIEIFKSNTKLIGLLGVGYKF